MAGEAIPNIGAPSMEEVAQAHLDKRRGAGATPFHKAAADEAAGRGVPFHTQVASPMVVGPKMSAAIVVGSSSAASNRYRLNPDYDKGRVSSTPIAAPQIGTPRRRLEDF